MMIITLTISITLAILLAGVLSTVIMFKLMGNAKFVKWMMNYYMKVIETSVESLDKEFSKDMASN